VPDEEQQVAVSIGPPVEPEYLRPIYANGLQINHGPHDFRLLFWHLRIPTHIDSGESPVHVQPQAVAEVIVPATLMHALITTMKQNFDTYLDRFGPPGMEPQGPEGPQR
jgi:hypothetical protein